MDDIVVVENLHKIYGKNIIAVDGISFNVKKNRIQKRRRTGEFRSF